MHIITAKSAGFCFGVAKAVNAVYEAAKTQKLCTYGPIIHNKTITSDLEKLGVRIINNLDEVIDETVVVRSHGVPAALYEEIEKRGLKYIDCTCRDVKKLHLLAQKAGQQGQGLIIVGDAKHPEIVGVNGHYSGAYPCIIVNTPEEVDAVHFEIGVKYVLVVQTTFMRSKFQCILDKLLATGIDIEVHDTICPATDKRLHEAIDLAKQVDAMIVIGDRQSSNTAKLYEACRKILPRTYLVESFHELVLNNFSEGDRIGITAGASTPPAITKEAAKYMSELENTTNTPDVSETQSTTQTFEEMLNESLLTLHTGDIVTGTVIAITPTEVSVNLGYKSDGILARSELTDDSNVDLETIVKIGDEIKASVIRVNDGEGTVMLSKRKLDAQKNMEILEKAFEDKTPLAGKVIEIVKGGLMVRICGMRAFVPSSQISNRFVEDLNPFKGKELNFQILEMNKSKRRIVAGRKELATVEQNQARDSFFDNVFIGQRLTGTVNRITNFGAFVDLGGVDGLIHVSELSWGRVKKVTDVLKEGDNVTVTVIDFNKDKNKISLTLKDIDNNPWSNIADKYPVGCIVTGKVVRIVPFGAFVQLEDGVDGLVHISQISRRHVAKPEDVLSIDDVINAKVVAVDESTHKISLSKREADADEEAYADENAMSQDYTSNEGYAESQDAE